MQKKQMKTSKTIKNRERQETRKNALFIEEPEAAKMLESYNIPYPPLGLSHCWKEAAQIADKIGYPVVLKIVSPDIIHKSDVGGIVVGIENAK